MSLTADPTVVALAAVGLYFGHHLGDRWVQTNNQAQTKGERSRSGRVACVEHVTSLTATQALLMGLLIVATGVNIASGSLALGLAVNAASHYWADRRTTLRGLAVALNPLTGKYGYYASGGAEALDQAWHIAWIVPAALIVASSLALALQLTGGALLVLLAIAGASRLARHREHRREAHTFASA